MAKVFIDSKGNRTTSGSTTKSRGGSSNSSALQKLAESVGGRVINDNQGGQKVEYQVKGNGFKSTRYLYADNETPDLSSPYDRKRDDGRNNPNRVTAQEPIDASQLGSNGQLKLPETPQVNAEVGTLAAGNTAVGLNADGTQKVSADGTQATTSDNFKNMLDSYLGAYPQPESVEQMYKKMPEKRAFEDASREVNKYSSQINAIVTKSQADQLAAIGQGRGIPEAIIGGQQAQIAREAAIQALPLQALLANAQGNKELAQQQLDTMFKLKMQDAQSQYDYKTKVLGLVYDYATNAEKRRLDDIQRKEDQAFELKKADIAFERDKYLQQMSFSNQLKLKQLDLQQPAPTPLSMAQSKSNIDEITKLTSQRGIGSAVGPSFVTRAPKGFWRNVGAIASIVGIPSVIKGNYQKLTGEQQSFISNVEQMRSNLTLDALINAKAQGATFGALTEKEMQLLASSATKIGTWAIEKDGKVIGYDVSQKEFKKELDKINNFAKIDYLEKGGALEDVGATAMPDGTIWVTNSDGTLTQIR